MTVNEITAEINGQTYTLTATSNENEYTAQLVRPEKSSGQYNNGEGPGVPAVCRGKGYYPVTLHATDDSGNVTTADDTDAEVGANLRVTVTETVAPVVTLISPTQGARTKNNKPAITFKATDAGSGINTASGRISIDGGAEAVVAMTGSGSEYNGTYTPANALIDGTHSISIYVYDYDKNKSAVVTCSFIVDTIPPSLAVPYPENNARINTLESEVRVQTDDATSSPVTVEVFVNGTSQGNVTLNNDGTGTHPVTYIEGENSLRVVATDAAGQVTEVTRTVYVDLNAPVIQSVSIVPNPADGGATLIITAVVTD